MAGWGDFVKLVENAVTDLAELEVKTFTGTMTSKFSDAQSADGKTKKKFNWDDIFDEGSQDSTVNLSMATKIYIDGDSDNYISDNVPADVKTAHLTAVDAGIKMRTALVEVFAKAVKLI